MSAAPRITGCTAILAHLGVPTEGFAAPKIYNPYFAARGIDAAVVPLGASADDFATLLPLVMRLSNVRGALVTMPHKSTTLGLVDDASPTARLAGACNAVRRAADERLVGDMFDGEGVVRAMARAGRSPFGASALVVGSGGAGSAIAAALATAGVARLGLADVDRVRSEVLAARLAAHRTDLALVVGDADPSGWDLVINATPLGMKPADPLPFDPSRLREGTHVGDVVLSAGESALVAAARARGCTVTTGYDMLFEMIPAYLEFFGLPTTTPDTLRRLADLSS
ncbi:shikimate dehydrogenase family protein [Acuticoccus sp.]|uniref:shikimate dehydrogenase family protein n=1 Tax=Acuticoccus sp. TaxID=1904378 RepID=UPI003B518C70